jgi:hypothetical protein
MKLRHRLTATILLIAFATTSALPAAGIPNLKTPATIKAVSAPPRVTTPPRVVTPPKVPVVPVIPKIPAAPKIVQAPVVKAPATPRVPAIKVPVVKAPTIKVPAAPKLPTTPRSVKAPVVVKVPTAPKPVLTVKVPTVKQPAVVKAPVAVKPAVVISKPSPIATKASDKGSKGGNSLADITYAPPPNTTVTIQGGNKSGGNSSSNTSSAADQNVADHLAALGFSDAEAAKIIAQLKDPATRAAAEAAVKGKSDAEATRQLISGLVGDEKAAEIGKKLADPATRQKTEKNLKLVMEASANLQLAGVDADKAARITDSFIRNGETDPKVINEIVGRVIIKDLTGKDVPQSATDDDADATTALDLVKTVLDAKANLELVGATDDDKAAQDAIAEIIKNRVTDPKQVRKIVEAAATTVLEEQGILPPAKPGETLQDRLARAAEEQKKPSEPKEPKKPVKKPGKEPVSLADSFKGRLASIVGAEEGKGPRNNTGSSPSVLEIVFGSKKPRTDGPKGVKDGKFTSGSIRGENVKGSGAGKGAGKGKAGEVGDAAGRFVGQVSQQFDTGGPLPAKDPDNSPIKDPTRSPNQPQDGSPVDNNTPPPAAGAADPSGAPATGNAEVSGEQNLPNTNPQQGDATDPAGSNMDTSTGTYTVTDAPTTNADGTTTVGFTVTGSPGGAEDGNYVTTYFSDGTYITERVTSDGGHELVGGGNGTPPNVQEGDSTNVVQGDQAVFAGDDSGDTTTSTENNGDTSGNGDGSNNNDDGDDDKDNSSTDTPPATTATEDAPADTAESNDDTAEASKEGTPNPEAAERGSRGGRLAEATQGRVGGDEQRRQNKGLDQRKNGNGAGGPNPNDNSSSGALLTAQEQKAFAKNLGMKKGGGVTTPSETDRGFAITPRDMKDIAAHRGSLVNPATTGDGKGGSGVVLGKKGFAPGGNVPSPSPKGVQSGDDIQGGGGVEGGGRTVAGSGTGGATGSIFGGTSGPGFAPVRAGAAAASSVRGANVRVNAAQVTSGAGR